MIAKYKKNEEIVVEVVSLKGKASTFKALYNGILSTFHKDEFEFIGTLKGYNHKVVSIKQIGKDKYKIDWKRAITHEEKLKFIEMINQIPTYGN
jgi:hypothetical protein